LTHRLRGEALDLLATAYAELRKHLYTDQNTLRHFVNVYVNEEDIRHRQWPSTPVKTATRFMIRAGELLVVK